MAKLVSLVAPGGAAGDTYGDLEIATGGVLADKRYVWVEKTPKPPKAYAVDLLPTQGVKASYTGTLQPAQTNLLNVAIVSSLSSSATGVSCVHLNGSTTIADGLYFQKDGSYAPFQVQPTIAGLPPFALVLSGEPLTFNLDQLIFTV